jgi:hypothetical protein
MAEAEKTGIGGGGKVEFRSHGCVAMDAGAGVVAVRG